MKFRLLAVIAFWLVWMVMVGVEAAPAQTQLTIAASGGPAVLGDAYGRTLATLIPRTIAGTTAVFQLTAGNPESIRLLGQKRADLAITGTIVAWEAFRGEGEFVGAAVPVRTLTPLHNVFVHVVTVEGTGITVLADLRGKRVTLPQVPAMERDALRILKAAGLDTDRDIQKVRLGLDDAAAALKDRRVDAFFAIAVLPNPTVEDLATTPGVRVKLLALDSVLPALNREFGPTYVKASIPKAYYPGLTADVPTIAIPFLLVARADLSADLAYQITKLVFERRADLARDPARQRSSRSSARPDARPSHSIPARSGTSRSVGWKDSEGQEPGGVP